MPDVPLNPASIVITGAGMITCLGLDRHAVWDAVRQGRCGMGPLPAMEQALAAGKDGGQAPELPADDSPDEAREVRYLRRTIIDALRDAGIEPGKLPCQSQRAGLMLGTTLHGMRAAGEYLRSGEYEPLSKFLAASVARSAARGLGLEGFAATTCSACSSALGAIAMGVTLLREGKLDLVVAGGYDPISEYVYAGFNSLRLVAEGPLRPFARDRQGMKLAEGYAVVVLERAEDAARRGRPAFATVLGFGESADAHHLTQPHPQGDGAARAVRAALASATLTPADIGLIAAHATGTPDNDAGEYQALSAVLGAELPRVPVVGFKSHVGHTLGGAGAVELILAATAMREGVAPPCANVLATDTDFAGLNLSAGAAQPANIRATLSTSLGFGGANTAMVLGRGEGETRRQGDKETGRQGDKIPLDALLPVSLSPSLPVSSSGHEVLITGVGVLLPGAIGNDAFVSLLRSPVESAEVRDSGPIEDEAFAHLINARRVRRLSQYVKYTLAAAALALKDAGVADVPAFCADCSAILGTTHGSTAFSLDYYGQVVREGIAAANPLLFAEGVPNAAAAHLSLMMSVKGGCQTIIGSRTAGLDALRLASARIAQGAWQRVLVGAGEEYSSIINAVYRTCTSGEEGARPSASESVDATASVEGRPPFAVGCGAVMLVLESRASVESREGGRVLAKVEATASASPGRPSPETALRVIRDLGPIDELVRSETGLWINRVEARALRLAGDEHALAGNVSSLYGRFPECFSAGPLAAVAAAALNGGIAGTSRSIGVVCTDVTGLVSGVRVARA